MDRLVPFLRVLAYLEERGWEFTGFYTPYRVFTKPGELPILVEVHDKKVTHEAFEHIKSIIEGEGPRKR